MDATEAGVQTLKRIGAVAAGLLLAAAPHDASAAGFQVRACDAAPAGVNNSWVEEATASAAVTKTQLVCPSSAADPYGDVAQGLSVHDVLEGPHAPADGSFREWRLIAPPTTAIAEALIHRDIGNRGTLQSGGYTPFGRIATGDLATETCYAPQGEFYCRIQGTLTVTGPTAALAWGVRCAGTSFCDGGYTLHDVWVSIRSAIVTIEDPVDPLVAEPAGELASGGWQRGSRGVVVEGSDVTGIRQVGVYRGVTPVVVRTAPGSQAGGCGQLNQGLAYTFTKPCEGSRGVNGAQVLDVDTAQLPDGTNGLRVVVRDTAGNEAEDELVVKVDNSAPAAPVVVADQAWAGSATAEWAWSGSVEADRAPVVKVEVERCLASQGCVLESVPGDSLGGPQSYEHLVPEGESTLRVRETDAAGNVGAWSEPSRVRRDRTAPTVSIEVPSSVVAPAAVQARVSAADALAGVQATEAEVSVDGGTWRSSTGSESLPAGSRVRFRARARDHAGNAGAWVESGEVVVERAPAPPPVEVKPSPSVSPTPTPTPTTSARTKVTLRGLSARRLRGRLTVRGRVAPVTATGRAVVQVGKRRVTGRVRRGRFTLTVLRVGTARRAVVRYLGDARHAPARRTVTIRAR